MHYSLPANVVSLSNVYCREPPPARHRHADAGRSSRVLRGIRRLHLEDEIDSSLLDDLASGDLSPGAFLHGRASFELTTELCERLAPHASFSHFFWLNSAMHICLRP